MISQRISNRAVFQKMLGHEWYIQGFNSVPLFVIACGRSGFTMRQELGFGYTEFVYRMQGGYGEMWYRQSDLQTLWRALRRKIALRPDYLQQCKALYEQTYARCEAWFQRITVSRLSASTDRQLLAVLRTALQTQTASVGIAHLLEPIGLALEREFTAALFRNVPDAKRFRALFAQLTTPNERSFVAQEASDLALIARMPKARRAALLRAHRRRYDWLRHSYVGPNTVQERPLRTRLAELRRSKNEQKRAWRVPRLTNKRVESMAATIRFATTWQDERKRNILRTIGYVGTVLDEVGRRVRVNPALLYYCTPTELMQLRSVHDLTRWTTALRRRRDGTYILVRPGGERIAAGVTFAVIDRLRQRSVHVDRNEQELHGRTANEGSAIGTVRLCLDLPSLQRVRAGDVLVASMTRPEFMPAMQKAAAFVTDEGGITSHAAIVSRELNKPCVIGTKFATKVLKDGDLVDVDATHGRVMVLKVGKPR